MSELLNEEVEAAIEEMVEESVVDTYYRMGHMISELSTGLLARAADEAKKRAKSARNVTRHSGAERMTKERQAKKFEGELTKRRMERKQRIVSAKTREDEERNKASMSSKERDKAEDKATQKYSDQLDTINKREDKARNKGSVGRAIKRTVRSTDVGGAETKRREKRYGTEDK